MRAATAVSLFGVSFLLAAPASAEVPGAPIAPAALVPPAPVPEAEAQAQTQTQAGFAPADDLQGPLVQDVGQPGTDVPPADVVYGPEPDLTEDETVAQSYDDGYDPQAAADFQQALDPYGSWYDDGTYGRVWIPSSTIVGTGFSPYATGGHWVLTEFGWTWVSDWSWGWAAFHYGRWIVLGRHGWCWVPGTIWGPGWVSWRAGGGFVGWAPLPPRGASLPPVAGHGTGWRFTRAEWMGKPVQAGTGTPGAGSAGKPASGFMGKPVPAYMTPAAVPGAFSRTRVVTTAPGAAGSWHLAAVAPNAMPHPSIRPRAGVPMAARPWSHSSAAQAVVGMGAGRSVAVAHPVRRPFAPHSTVGISLRPPSSRGGSFGGGAAGVAQRHYVYAAPVRGYTPPARAYEPSVRTFVPPVRTYSPPAARFYVPPVRRFAPPVRTFAPTDRTFAPTDRTFAPPVRTFAPPVHTFAPPVRTFAPPVRTFAPPPVFRPAPAPVRTFAPPARFSAPQPQFSAPRSFGSPGGFGGARPSFGGGGRRR